MCAQMDLFCGMIIFYLLIVSFWLLRQEEKKKSQPGERLVKDERILNLQKKIVEKTMERKKQAGLLKISPQKTRIVSSKVWLLHKEKRSAIDLLFTDLCSSASTGKGQRQMVPYMAGNNNTLPPAWAPFLQPWPWPHLVFTCSAVTEQDSSIQHLPPHSYQHTLIPPGQHLTPAPLLVFPSFLSHTSHHTILGCSPFSHQGMLQFIIPMVLWRVAAVFKSS